MLLLTRPWTGGIDPAGVGFALCAAVLFAGYILLTRRVGDECEGSAGLAVSLPVAAVVATVLTRPSAAVAAPETLALGLLLALAVPLLPFLLELHALRRLTAAAFATLVCLQPAFAALVGLVLLGQQPGRAGLAGMACVVVAGIGAVRTGQRPPVAVPDEPVPDEPVPTPVGSAPPVARTV